MMDDDRWWREYELWWCMMTAWWCMMHDAQWLMMMMMQWWRWRWYLINDCGYNHITIRDMIMQSTVLRHHRFGADSWDRQIGQTEETDRSDRWDRQIGQRRRQIGQMRQTIWNETDEKARSDRWVRQMTRSQHYTPTRAFTSPYHTLHLPGTYNTRHRTTRTIRTAT